MLIIYNIIFIYYKLLIIMEMYNVILINSSIKIGFKDNINNKK